MGKARLKGAPHKGTLKFSADTGRRGNDLQNSVRKISADIGAINLGPPRTKILKKTGASSSSLTSNFASRTSLQQKQKKKVTFCQNLVAEELVEPTVFRRSDVKDLRYTLLPTSSKKRLLGRLGKRFSRTLGNSEPTVECNKPKDSYEADPEVLVSSSASALRKIIKSSVKTKKIRLKAKKETFKKKMDLLKASKEEFRKAKQREQTVIIGDMHPMLNALPSLDDLDQEKTETETETFASSEDQMKRTLPKNVNKHSVKKTKQAILDSLKFFEASGVTVNCTKTS